MTDITVVLQVGKGMLNVDQIIVMNVEFVVELIQKVVFLLMIHVIILVLIMNVLEMLHVMRVLIVASRIQLSVIMIMQIVTTQINVHHFFVFECGGNNTECLPDGDPCGTDPGDPDLCFSDMCDACGRCGNANPSFCYPNSSPCSYAYECESGHCDACGICGGPNTACNGDGFDCGIDPSDPDLCFSDQFTPGAH
jgi:hypothetical protein